MSSPILEAGASKLAPALTISIDDIVNAGLDIKKAIIKEANKFDYSVSEEEVPPIYDGGILNPKTGQVVINGAWSKASVIDFVCPPGDHPNVSLIIANDVLQFVCQHVEETDVEAWRNLLADRDRQGLFVVRNVLPTDKEVAQKKAAAVDEWTQTRVSAWDDRIAGMTLAEAKNLYRECRRRDPGVDPQLNLIHPDFEIDELMEEHPNDLDAAEVAVIKNFMANSASSLVRERVRLAKNDIKGLARIDPVMIPTMEARDIENVIARREHLIASLTSLALAMDAHDSEALIEILSDPRNIRPRDVFSDTARDVFVECTGLELPNDRVVMAETLRYWVRMASAAERKSTECRIDDAAWAICAARNFCGDEKNALHEWEEDNGKLSADERLKVKQAAAIVWASYQREAGVKNPITPDERAKIHSDLECGESEAPAAMRLRR